VLIVGIVTGLFILLFLMKDWRLVTDATSNRIAAVLGLPAGVGRQIVTDTVHSFRGYAWGLTIVGLMNAAVVGFGASCSGSHWRCDRDRHVRYQLHPVLRGVLRRGVRRADRPGRRGCQRRPGHAGHHPGDEQHPAEPGRLGSQKTCAVHTRARPAQASPATAAATAARTVG
jgi:hypothetical protein